MKSLGGKKKVGSKKKRSSSKKSSQPSQDFIQKCEAYTRNKQLGNYSGMDPRYSLDPLGIPQSPFMPYLFGPGPAQPIFTDPNNPMKIKDPKDLGIYKENDGTVVMPTIKNTNPDRYLPKYLQIETDDIPFKKGGGEILIPTEETVMHSTYTAKNSAEDMLMQGMLGGKKRRKRRVTKTKTEAKKKTVKRKTGSKPVKRKTKTKKKTVKRKTTKK